MWGKICTLIGKNTSHPIHKCRQGTHFTSLDHWSYRWVAFSALTLLVGRQEGHPARKNMGWRWRWALVSLDGVAPSRMVSVSADVNLPLHHKVQKFSSGTGSPGWSRKKGCKTVVVVVILQVDISESYYTWPVWRKTHGYRPGHQHCHRPSACTHSPSSSRQEAELAWVIGHIWRLAYPLMVTHLSSNWARHNHNFVDECNAITIRPNRHLLPWLREATIGTRSMASFSGQSR